MKLPAITTFLVLTSLFTSAQFATGYYIDSSGNKIPGLLKFLSSGPPPKDKSNGDCRVRYKKDSLSKTVSFAPKEIKGFVIGSDSFTVIHDFRLNPNIYYYQEFVKVLETGTIKLLEFSGFEPKTLIGTPPPSYYILEKAHKGHLISAMDFRKIMAALMEEDPDLVERIMKKEFKYKHTREVVAAYNKYVAEHS